MTATIAPPAGAPGLIRTDPTERLRDYATALDFYVSQLGRCIDAILFLDNSKSSVATLQDLAAARGAASKVSIISFDGNDHPPSYGRCYGELRLLEYAMASDIVTALPDDTEFWKVTGRYRLLNIGTMLRTRPQNADLYVDLRSRPSPWFDMRVMSWTKRGFGAALFGLRSAVCEDANAGRPGEETAYFEMQTRLAGVRAVTAFRREPYIEGLRAFDNKNWRGGRQSIVYGLRQAQRMIFSRTFF